MPSAAAISAMMPTIVIGQNETGAKPNADSKPAEMLIKRRA